MIRSTFRWVIGFSFASLALAAEGAAVPDAVLLDRIGLRVKQVWDDFSTVTCTENLTQEKFNEKGKVVLASRANFDYLIALRWNGNDLLVDESRLEVGPPRKKRPEGALLATRGFATMLLILHPDFQSSFYLTSLPDEDDSGRKLAPVAFVHRDAARSPGVLELKGREYPIAWEGTAWIDRATAMVVRVQAHWKEPAEEIGLEELSSDVRYGPVSLGSNRTYWLPESALIEVKTRHQHWRNSHQFTHYRLFSVESDSKVEETKKQP